MADLHDEMEFWEGYLWVALSMSVRSRRFGKRGNGD